MLQPKWPGNLLPVARGPPRAYRSAELTRTARGGR